MATRRDTMRKGKAADHYASMRLLQNNMVPYIPVVDYAGVDLVVETSAGAFAKIQVKSRGFPLPERGSYGEQIKDLWWSEGIVAFDYLIIVLPKEEPGTYESWVVPASTVKERLSKGGDLTLTVKLLREEWREYSEGWQLIGAA